MIELRVSSVVLAAAVLLGGGLAMAEVAGLKITTDRRIDTSSVRRIVEQVVKPGMTDRQKAVALWRFASDYNYFYPVPWEPPRDDMFATGVVNDVMKLINVYGYAYCFQHRSILEALWEEAGLEARSGGIHGHSIPAVFYDGQYHYLDSSQQCYCVLPDGRTIASRDQVAEDPMGLMVHQKHPSDPYLPGAPRALLTFEDRHVLAGLFFLHDFYNQHDKFRTAHSMGLTLPAGARMTWHWRGLGKWRQKSPKGDWEMRHFGHYNPYDGPVERGGSRTYANAVYRFRPDLATGADELIEALVAAENLGLTRGAVTNATRGRAVADLRVRLPYVICGWPTVLEPKGKPTGAAVVSGRAQCLTGGRVALLLSLDEGLTYTEVWRLDTPRYTNFAVDVSPLVDGRYAFRLRIVLSGPAGAARIEDLAIDVNTQAAQLPLPALVPGRNRITIDLGDRTKVMERNRPFKSLKALRRAAHEVKNLRVERGYLRPKKGETGEVTFRIAAPAGHDLTGLSVGGTMRTGDDPPPDESIEIFVAAGRASGFKPVWAADIPPDIEHWCYEVDEPVTLPAGARVAYVKYRIRRMASAAVAVPRIVAHYRRRGETFPPDGLRVRYAWRENGQPRSHEQVVKTAPFTYTITVPKDATVKMDRLEVEAVRPGRAPIGEGHRLFVKRPALHRRDFRDPVSVPALRQGLARIRRKPDLDTFIDLFKTSKHPLLRTQLAAVVAYVGAESDPEGAEAVLIEAAKGTDEQVAKRAKKALPRLYRALPDAAQLAALKHAKAARRVIAVEVLTARRVPGTADAIAPLLSDRAASVRRATALALARLGDGRAVPVLVELMEKAGSGKDGKGVGPSDAKGSDAISGTRYVEVLRARLPFAVSLFALDDRRGDVDIERALTCRDRYHRHDAARLLSEIAGPKAERLLMRALRDEWAYVRRAAIVGLARHGGPSALTAVQRLAETDPVVWVRSEAAHAVRRIARRTPRP